MFAINRYTGAQIRGTYEQLHGCAQASEDSFQRDSGGGLTFEHDGWTEVYWDDSLTEYEDGKMLYVDANGHTVTADDIVLVDKMPAAPQPALQGQEAS